MPELPPLNLAMPTTVGELAAFTVEIRCRRCGRTAAIEPAKLNTARGRAIDRRMPLRVFLGKLTCTAKACGEKPERLHISIRGPRGPGDAPAPLYHWAMDAQGRWTYLGTDGE